MKKYWEQLRPMERRWAVGAGCLVFLMLNYFFIWPHRHDWAKDEQRLKVAEAKMNDYDKEISKKSVYMTKLRMLQASGEEVLPEDQAIDFVHFYSSRMYSNHVVLLNGGSLTTRTNTYTTDQQLGISVQANETNLVSFLYSLASGNSMVRVRAMSLHPTPDHHELNAGITMVASYQKRAVSGASKNVPAAPAKNTVTQAPKTPAATPAPKAATPPPANKPPMTTGRTPPPAVNALAPSNRFARLLHLGASTNKTNQ